MYALYRKSDNLYFGDIGDEEFQFLVDNLEEEGLNDTDYNITRMTLDYLKENGLSPHLAKIIETAMADQDEVDIVYQPK